MNFISAKEAAAKWGISQRRVAVLCAEKRINGASMVGNMWIIPARAKKPLDLRSFYIAETSEKKAKPFLKWAGGKGQLISEIERYYPFADGRISKYAEPFVGGGAVLFDVLSKFALEEVYISDINEALINAYTLVRNDVDELIELLKALQEDFVPLENEVRKIYYSKKRERFNVLMSEGENCALEKAALFIFLNKTCFNGLYRVNRKGFFNVPMGAYRNPLICDEENLRAVSEKLKDVKIVCGDYKKSASFIDEHTFVYFDPPYRPLTDTASFTAYTENLFSDEEQIELAKFVDDMHKRGAKVVVSNSDPKNPKHYKSLGICLNIE